MNTPAVLETLIDRAVQTIEPDLIALRRAIHRHPELSGDERQTAVMPGVGLPGRDDFAVDLSGMHAADDAAGLSAAVEALSTVRLPASPEDFDGLLTAMLDADGPLDLFICARCWTTTGQRPGQVRAQGLIKAGSDDLYPAGCAALFLEHIPGAMFFLGAGDPQAGFNAFPHAPNFAVDERAISIGTRAMARWLTSRLHSLSAAG